MLSSTIQKGMDLRHVVQVLNRYCSPHLADSWDNVGLLIQPSTALIVSHALVTNDLTEPVLTEAIQMGVNLIVSYHPPIFSPLKRITDCHWKERLVATCLEKRIAVYSPHTGLDAKINGINDWLLSPFELECKKPITAVTGNKESSVTLTFPMSEYFSQFCINFPGVVCNTGLPGDVPTAKVSCSASLSQSVVKQAESLGLSPIASEVVKEADRINEGYGRIGCLKTPTNLSKIVQAYKCLFGVDHLILAVGYGRQLDEPIRTIAVCAGSGGSILNGKTIAQVADLFVTGEMSHHDRLDAISRGTSVIIVGHSNTERGYLKSKLVPELQELLRSETCSGDSGTSSVLVSMSKVDSEPGVVV